MLFATHLVAVGSNNTARNALQMKKELKLNRKAYKINEVAKALSLSRTTIYKLISQGELQRIKLGASTLIAADSVEALLQRNVV